MLQEYDAASGSWLVLLSFVVSQDDIGNGAAILQVGLPPTATCFYICSALALHVTDGKCQLLWLPTAYPFMP